jgi:hypothetical protein
LGELGLSCPCHNFHVFVGFLPILVGGDRCKQFKAIRLLGAFEINVRAFSLRGYITCVPSFEQLVEKNVDHLQESILERLHDHSFINFFYNLPSNWH